jgi:AcrR family transcriptional regulator
VALAGPRGKIPAGRHGLSPAAVEASQRARILAATFEIIGRRGVHGLVVRDVLEVASVSRRTYFEIFGDREGCLTAALELGYARLVQAARAGDARASGDWRARVRCAVASVLALMEDEPALARLCVVEPLSCGARAIAIRRVALGHWAELLDVVYDGPGVPAAPTAMAAVGAAVEVAAARLTDPVHAPSPSALEDLVTYALVAPYAGAAEAASELRGSARPPRQSPQPRVSASSLVLTRLQRDALAFVAENPGANNRAVGAELGVRFDSATSRIMSFLARRRLVTGPKTGRDRAWTITAAGERSLTEHDLFAAADIRPAY